MTPFAYLSTASFYLLVFYGFYWLLLGRTTFFKLNRAYLLVSIGLSLVLPLVQLPVNAPVSLPIRRVTLPTVVVGADSMAESGGWTVGVAFGLIYGLGVGFTLLRLILTVAAVFRIIRRGMVDHKEAYSLVRLPDQEGYRIPSFSFGRYLVLNHADGLTAPAALMRHEEAHISQFHTVDVLFLEVVNAFFWFNPVLRFYKIALQTTHEFLADRAAVRKLSTASASHPENQPSYAQQLVAYALHVPINALTTPFASQSTLKKRLTMLQKPSTHSRALLAYVFVLPLISWLVMCTQAEKDLPLNVSALVASQAEKHTSAKVDGEVFTVVEQQPEFPGGMAALGQYLNKNLHYPAAAQKVNAEGRVFVSFVVTKTGAVTDVKVLKGIGFGTEEEARRIVEQMPPWIPARQNGQFVNVRFNLPINFQLDDFASRQVTHDFWNGLSKYKLLTLDGTRIDKGSMKNIAEQALKDDVHISFSIDDPTSTVAFNHVDN